MLFLYLLEQIAMGLPACLSRLNTDCRERTANGSISSKGLGGYVTWQKKAPTDRKPGTGAYGVSSKSVSGFDLQSAYKGKATTASIETGYGFDLGNNIVLQPQAQLTWSKVKAESFAEAYGIAVHGQEAYRSFPWISIQVHLINSGELCYYVDNLATDCPNADCEF